MASAGAIKNVDHCTISSAFRFVLPLEVVMCRVREEGPACCGPWLLRARSARTGIAVAAFVIAMVPLRLVADERVDAAAVAAIIAEAEQSSEAAEIFYELTDRLGPRLSGSPAYDRAARWTAERFQTWGLAAVRLEPFAFGRGWTLRALTVEMVAPRYMPLIGYAEAWSPPTSGVLTGTPVYIGDSTAEEIDSLADRLESAIVLAARPQVEFLSEDRPQPAANQTSVQTGNPPFRRLRARRLDQSCSRASGLTGPASRFFRARPSTEPCACRASGTHRPMERRPWCSPPSITTCSFGSWSQELPSSFGLASTRSTTRMASTATTFSPRFQAPMPSSGGRLSWSAPTSTPGTPPPARRTTLTAWRP